MEDDSELKVLPRMEFSQDVGFFGPLIGFVLGIEFKGVGEEDGTKSDEGQEMVFHDFLTGDRGYSDYINYSNYKDKKELIPSACSFEDAGYEIVGEITRSG
jgi:hypothetical protein